MQNLVELLTNAATYMYKNDPTKPGVVISQLSPGTYYVSVVRFEKPYGNGKKVVCSSKGSSLEKCLEKVSSKLVEKKNTEKNPIDELADYFSFQESEQSNALY